MTDSTLQASLPRKRSLVKRYMPRSLFWRTVLIVVTPMIILQAVVAYLVVQRHFDGVTRQMTESLVSELQYIVEVAEDAPSAEDAKGEVRRAGRALGYDIHLIRRATLPRNTEPKFFDVIGRAIEETFRKRFGARPLFVDIIDDEKIVDVRLQTSHGVIATTVPKRRLIVSNPHLLLAWMGATALALIFIAVIYLRNQIRPIQQLANAADAFGKGRTLFLRPSGAEEVRRAGAAFLDMRRRIERQIEQRTTMLSGVSHDMRTPLTRMKLALEIMEDTPELGELRSDVVELERILEEFLDFARGDRMEQVAPTDVIDLLNEIATEARRGDRDVAFDYVRDTDAPVELSLRRQSIKRCLHNLVSNALAYGNRAEVMMWIRADIIEIAVEDDGPGISPADRDAAFQPFKRLDAARNQDRVSGVGLGLALARDAVRGHGGELSLEDSRKLGGLRALIRLPR
ncbi:MAG: ATP-binding protein [Pseudomonadota bacterium]